MEISKKFKLRITFLYLFLVGFIFLWLASEIRTSIGNLKPPVELGNGICYETISNLSKKSFFNSDYDIPVDERPDGTVVKAKIRTFSAKVFYRAGSDIRDAKYGQLSKYCHMFSFCLLLSLILILLRIIFLFIKGIKSENYFPSQNIILTRILGVLVLFYVIIDSLSQALNALSYKHLFANTDFRITSYIAIDFETLIVVLTLFILSEVFLLGNVLSNDNKMTI
jgi:hypothetical protein